MKRLLGVALALLLAACSPTEEASPATTAPPTTTTTTTPSPSTTTARADLTLGSPAFADGEAIPADYTCDGADVSPELEIAGIPSATQSITIIVTDPDAPLGTWDHWVEFDIPISGTSVDMPRDTPLVGVAGVNSWHLEGYMGPCPPAGEEHTYVFTVYAVDGFLGLPHGVDSEAVISAMNGLLVDTVELTGTFSR